MKQGKEAKLTDYMDGFKAKHLQAKEYETSFRRWLISQIDNNNLSIEEARDRFQLSPTEYKKIIRRWQERYSDELHLSLSLMSSQERADNQKLEQRIKELEKQLELAQMKNVALNTLIDVAETELKLPIRKKSGSKQ